MSSVWPLRPQLKPPRPQITFRPNSGFSNKQVAQGQYVVSDTRCPTLHDSEFVSGEAGQWPNRGEVL